MLIHVENKEQFDNLIKEGTAIVDFFATWCGPCKMLTPVLEEVSEEKPDIKILKVDVDKNMDIANIYRIQAVPTLLLYKDGNLVETRMGYMNKNQIYSFLNK